MGGPSKQANIHMHVHNEVMLVWGSLRLTPIKYPLIHVWAPLLHLRCHWKAYKTAEGRPLCTLSKVDTCSWCHNRRGCYHECPECQESKCLSEQQKPGLFFDWPGNEATITNDLAFKVAIPYNWKYWWSLNLAVWPQSGIKKYSHSAVLSHQRITQEVITM